MKLAELERRGWRAMALNVSTLMGEYVTWTVSATTAAIGLTVTALPALSQTASVPLLKMGVLFLGISVGAGAAAKFRFMQVIAALASDADLRKALGLAAPPVLRGPITLRERVMWRRLTAPIALPFRWFAQGELARTRLNKRSPEWMLVRRGSVGTRLVLWQVATAVTGFALIGLSL